MDFVVTARKWRPQRFDEVVGQEHITSTLKNAIREKRIAHAYLFTGPRGVGKTTTARIFAKALNCENPKDTEPCNECSLCKSIQNNQLMDIIEIDGASNRGIDEIRTLRESVKYAPTRGKYKIYIIDEVHMLTKESFNAFLKTLEEPPSHTIFIFATTDAHKVPLTIISRCQRYDFRRIQLDVIKETLKAIAKEEKIEIDDTTLTIISKKADGALRDAESYFDQVVSYCQGKIDPETVSHMLNLIDEEVYFKITDAVQNKNFKSVFEVTETIYNNGWDFLDFLDGLTEHFRNILTVTITHSSNAIESAEVFKKRYLNYADKFSESDLLRLLNFLNKSQQELRFSQNQKLKVEIILSHLIALEKTSTISNIISEIESGNNDSGKNESSSGFFKENPVPEKKTLSGFNTETSRHDKRISEGNVSYQTEVFASKNKTEINIPGDIDFDEIVKRWKGFVDLVCNEKSLTLSPFFQTLELVSFKGNNLNFSAPSELDKKTFEMNEKYIEKRAEEYFGKRIRFSQITKPATEIKNRPFETENLNPYSDKVSGLDPYEDIILNELGGEKIG